MLPSKEKLEEALEILQCIMRVQDWDVELKLLSAYDMSKEQDDFHTAGAIEIDRKHNHACLKLNKEIDDMPDKYEKENWYRTIIHELMHLLTDSFMDDISFFISNDKWVAYKDKLIEIEERLVNRFADIFCEIYPMESLEEE